MTTSEFVVNVVSNAPSNGERVIPWSAKEFASRHNKKLKGARAAKAASMANAMLRSGTDEGIAIATANKYANKHKKLPHNGSISESVAKKHGYA